MPARLLRVTARTALIILLPLVGARPSKGQLTLTAENFRSVLDRANTVTLFNAVNPEALRGLIALRGGGHTFDFTATSFQAVDTTRYEPVACGANVPGCDVPAFSGANLRLRALTTGEDAISYAYYDIQPGTLRLLGTAARHDFDDTRPGEETLVGAYEPAARQLMLPLTATSQWSDAHTLRLGETGQTPIFTTLIETESAVRAWGVVVTPAGSYPALMLEERRRTITSTFGQVIRDSTVTYSFITGAGVQAEVTLDPESSTVSASYSTYVRNATAISPSPETGLGLLLDAPKPNPARTGVSLSFTLDALRAVVLTVHDALGREIARLADGLLPAGTHEARWNASDAPAGVYAVRLSAGGALQTRTVTLVR
ncbi:MAG TPA: T9SS type A sorting domain-containing protein [Rhodothermales bacterium]|nr:T9SS type A sorting domain-containing protein [Rhodothermales bacterium]